MSEYYLLQPRNLSPWVSVCSKVYCSSASQSVTDLYNCGVRLPLHPRCTSLYQRSDPPCHQDIRRREASGHGGVAGTDGVVMVWWYSDGGTSLRSVSLLSVVAWEDAVWCPVAWLRILRGNHWVSASNMHMHWLTSQTHVEFVLILVVTSSMRNENCTYSLFMLAHY